jgi:hypothetical protein
MSFNFTMYPFDDKGRLRYKVVNQQEARSCKFTSQYINQALCHKKIRHGGRIQIF